MDEQTSNLKKSRNQSENFICLPSSDYPRIVIIGGGFAGLSLARTLRKKKVQVVLLDKNNYHQFQPLLYQVATSGLEPDSIAFPYRKQLWKYKNVHFRLTEVEEISPEHKTIKTDKGSLTYDYLVLATGTKTNFFGNKEMEKNSLGLKEIRDSLNIRHRMLLNLEQAAITCNDKDRDALTNFVIVGGGPAGVEMAGALAEFCKYVLPKDYKEYPSSIMKIYLLEGSGKLISGMSETASTKALNYLKKMNVKVMLNTRVTAYDGRNVVIQDNEDIIANNLIWTAGVTGQLPEGISKEHLVGGNRLKTNQFLQIEGLENVFAMGDIAAVITEDTPRGHSQVAQPAIQQGKFLAKTILLMIDKKPLVKGFKYKDKGSLATIGKRKAVADLGKFKFGGYFAWLIWSFVHLMSISGFRNKVLVGLNWAMSYFSYDKSNRLIIDKNIKTDERNGHAANE
ncbi:MAG: NAD(P)/FAD-dependent oxidoreductase [Fluviicola sp.]|nr:NAD(P)/FAD-dependent oxidoreductase [Fluviicola sp.]